MDDRERWRALGEFIRTQRKLGELSLRQLATLAQISNPYLSQIERGQYRPSADVLMAIAGALGISRETLYAKAGLLDEDGSDAAPDVEAAIRADTRLSGEQKAALLSVYRGFIGPRTSA